MFTHGGVAQLGEHLPCKQGVRSSILLISTTSVPQASRLTDYGFAVKRKQDTEATLKMVSKGKQKNYSTGKKSLETGL